MRGLHCVPLLLLLTAGCWQARYFTPRENLNGTGPDGRPAALYKVQEDAATQSQGDVRIWSAGAKARFVEDDKEVVELHVGFEIENTGKVPLELVVDSLALEELFVDGYLQDVMAPNSTNGSGLAAPGSTAVCTHCPAPRRPIRRTWIPFRCALLCVTPRARRSPRSRRSCPVRGGARSAPSMTLPGDPTSGGRVALVGGRTMAGVVSMAAASTAAASAADFPVAGSFGPDGP